jgi:hypothetical protein
VAAVRATVVEAAIRPDVANAVEAIVWRMRFVIDVGARAVPPEPLAVEPWPMMSSSGRAERGRGEAGQGRALDDELLEDEELGGVGPADVEDLGRRRDARGDRARLRRSL